MRGKGLNHERGRRNPNYRHGLSIDYRHSQIYGAWGNMVQRCENPSNKDWKYYGGRGIVICSSLRRNVVRLRELIGDPSKGKTLNRIDNDGNYTCGQCGDCLAHDWPMNVEWADSKTQSRNRGSFNHKITFLGQTHCITEWADILKIKSRTIKGRIQRGWKNASEILSTDVSTNRYKRL